MRLLLGLALLLGACSSPPSGADRSAFVRDLAVGACGDAGANDWHLQSWPNNDAGALTVTNPGSGLPANLAAVWGTSAMAVWAVGSEGKVMFFDGQTWSAQATPTKQNLTSIWGSGPKDVWAAGFDGTVIHFDGVKWADSSPPDIVFVPPGQDGGPPKGDAATGFRRILWGVWGFGSANAGTDELYAVGEQGLVVHWAKTGWTAVPSNVEDRLNAIWGSGGTVTIVGDFGTLLTGSTAGLSKVNTSTARTLNAVWGRDGHTYVIGQNGTFLHGSGGSFSEVQGPPKQVLKGLWGPPSDSSKLYMVGIDGTLLRMTGGPDFDSPTVQLYPCLTKNRIDGIWGYEVPATPNPSSPDAGQQLEERIWAVGVSGTIIIGP